MDLQHNRPRLELALEQLIHVLPIHAEVIIAHLDGYFQNRLARA